MKKSVAYLLGGLCCLPFNVLAQDGALDDLGELSLESLGEIVTSVSRKPEDSFRSAAAIHVITNEDIKLSGATHIAETLRMVPGLNVSRIDSSNWAITSRGFNGLFANKLLVLIDGRTVYTPLFSGVYWDVQNMPLEDVERIEVIRGPGASLWGANAVNGIINIITKNSADTQGTYASTLAGNEDRSISDVRYGGKLDDNAYFRVYGHYENRDSTQTLSDTDGNNEWDNAKTGFRSDWKVSETRNITLQGDAYSADIDLDLAIPSLTSPTGVNAFHDDIRSRGVNLLGRWEEKHNDEMQTTFQAYYDFQGPDYSSLRQDISTFDFDYQTSWDTSDRNNLMWGGGARYIDAKLQGSNTIMANKPNVSQSILSAFIQDQYALSPKDVFITLGSKFEHNTFAGFVVEPSARLAWYPDNRQTLWAAISRAVRTPSITDHSQMNFNVLAFPPYMVQWRSDTGFDPEELIAYEVGYRVRPHNDVSIDSTVFLNDYDNLSTVEPGLPDGIYLPYYFSNLGEGKSYGFETTATWDVTSRWDLMANYSYINLMLDQDPTSADPIFQGMEGDVPHHQFMLRSQLFLPCDVRMVNAYYYSDDLPNQRVEAYSRFDTQFIWKATEGLELAVVGQNLFDDNHPEYGAPPDGVPNQIPRAFYGRLTLRY